MSVWVNAGGTLISGPVGSTAPAVDALRLSLHVLAAAVWVGGQFTLAGLVGTARQLGPGAPKALARAFARLSWPAYAVLVLTGLWNIQAAHPSAQSLLWRTLLGVKIGVVALAGLSAWLHSRAHRPAGLAVWGGVSALTSVSALVLGVVLAG